MKLRSSQHHKPFGDFGDRGYAVPRFVCYRSVIVSARSRSPAAFGYPLPVTVFLAVSAVGRSGAWRPEFVPAKRWPHCVPRGLCIRLRCLSIAPEVSVQVDRRYVRTVATALGKIVASEPPQRLCSRYCVGVPISVVESDGHVVAFIGCGQLSFLSALAFGRVVLPPC